MGPWAQGLGPRARPKALFRGRLFQDSSVSQCVRSLACLVMFSLFSDFLLVVFSPSLVFLFLFSPSEGFPRMVYLGPWTRVGTGGGRVSRIVGVPPVPQRALGPGPWALGPGPWVLGPGPWALGPGPRALGPGPWVRGLGPWAQGLGPWALGPWALGPGPKMEKGKIDLRPTKKSTGLPDGADRSISSRCYD